MSVALKQITEEPVPPSEINPEISPELESIILRGMSKSPQDRFTSAAEMKEALSELNGGEPAFPVNGQKEKVKTRKLRPAGWVALAAALLLVAVIGYFAALGFLTLMKWKCLMLLMRNWKGQLKCCRKPG